MTDKKVPSVGIPSIDFSDAKQLTEFTWKKPKYNRLSTPMTLACSWSGCPGQLRDKSSLRNHLLSHVPDPPCVRMREGIFREWGTKVAFSCACCRSRFTALLKGAKNPFPWTLICVHMHTCKHGRNILYAPFQDCERRFVQANNTKAYILT
jgi:hypothetical protein